MKIKEEVFLKSLNNKMLTSQHPRSIDVIEITTFLLECLDYGSISNKKDLASLNKAVYGIYDYKEKKYQEIFHKIEKTTFIKPIINLILINLEQETFIFDNWKITTTKTKKDLLEKVKEILVMNYRFIIQLIEDVFENKIPYIIIENRLLVNNFSIISSVSNVYIDHIEVIQEKINELDYFFNEDEIKDINFYLKEQQIIEKKLNEEIKNGKRFTLFYQYSNYYSGSRSLLDQLKKDFSLFLKKEERNEENPIFEISEKSGVQLLIPFYGKINKETFLFVFGEKSEFPAEIKASILYHGKFL